MKSVLLPAIGLEGATIQQKSRVFDAACRTGHWATRLAVRAEINEEQGWKDEGPMGAILPMELLDLYARMEEAESSAERYAILAEPLPQKAQDTTDRQLVWFDIIRGLTALHIVKSIGQAAYDLTNNGILPWKAALDLGTGTGNLASILLGRHQGIPRSVESLTTLDNEQSLLAIARSRYPEADHVLGDVVHMPFDGESFDLIVSGGLVYGLDPASQAQLFSEVARVLRPDGVYIDGNYRNEFTRPDTTQNIGPKHHLESLIVSLIAPTEIAATELHVPQNFAQLGLLASSRAYVGKHAHEITDIRVLHKSQLRS